ncbi:hypothetical protein [Salimicrobium album]|uniref:Uncharacterized protein n=1 Tax=Salimicrobium album TaxID=50717 RepID=A0A1H3DA90_9BACI|nr:hypothetical protein [Salimicrobium album]SDX63353.1 hypothetical protein SAMN04488081_0888 [Salimicrobium album]
MNFSLLKVDQPKKLKSLSKNKINFLKKEEEISLFHFNQFENGLFHVVFNISDEYQVSTLKLGTQYNFVYSSLVNFFFIINEQLVFIEYVNNEYQKEVLKEIERRTKVNLNSVEINNFSFKKIYECLGGNVKRINFSDEEEGLLSDGPIISNRFYEIEEGYKIDDITFLINDRFLKVTKNGKISVDNSDEQYLTEFVKKIINVLH